METAAAEALLKLLAAEAPEAVPAVVDDLANGAAWGAAPPGHTLWPLLVRCTAEGGGWRRAVELTKVTACSLPQPPSSLDGGPCSPWFSITVRLSSFALFIIARSKLSMFFGTR